jgi:short-subunit dehydrogenase
MQSKPREGRGHTALVTGASSGIGRALTHLLAQRGYDIVVVARRADRLDAVKHELEPRYGVTVSPLVSDLAEPGSVESICTTLDQRDIAVDFLVNNAGYALAGHYAETSWEDQERFARVMALAPLELTHRLLPAMLAGAWGRILNVSSIAALTLASPNSILYAATKTMLMTFSEGLALECARSGVQCTVSLPGVTATEFFERSGLHEHESRRITQALLMSPETVAREAYDAVMAGRPRVVHGWHHRLLGSVVTHAPTPVRRRLALIADAR